ncbi:lactococcin 972 family bacteriocin [Streptomyces sp. CC224B]|uniref:lactococcin 972 family bacteriocin n=1 Tax=Streptomyces sp. CC224B TaxID=3044571 RepID=UPI0024A81B2E|nr:lactococcin 972 family bacteriocin [Streptomyces sp. CC224B]
MKVSSKAVVIAVAGAALAGGVLTAPANANSPQTDSASTLVIHKRGDGTEPPAELGDPEEWGVVEIAMDDSTGGPATKKIVEVGGGKWSYGWMALTSGKRCYSNYYHLKKKHGSTAQLGGMTSKDVVKANETSNASVTGPGRHTCVTYWSKY